MPIIDAIMHLVRLDAAVTKCDEMDDWERKCAHQCVEPQVTEAPKCPVCLESIADPTIARVHAVCGQECCVTCVGKLFKCPTCSGPLAANVLPSWRTWDSVSATDWNGVKSLTVAAADRERREQYDILAVLGRHANASSFVAST